MCNSENCNPVQKQEKHANSMILLCGAILIISPLIMADDTIQRKVAFTGINKHRHLSLTMPPLISMDAHMRGNFLVNLVTWVAYTIRAPMLRYVLRQALR